MDSLALLGALTTSSLGRILTGEGVTRVGEKVIGAGGHEDF